MADQTVKIQNDSGSYERVALDLMARIIDWDEQAQNDLSTGKVLQLYVKCRKATYGAAPE